MKSVCLPLLLLAGAAVAQPSVPAANGSRPAAAGKPALAKPTPVVSARLAAAEKFARSIDLMGQLRQANAISSGQLESRVLAEIISRDPDVAQAKARDPEKFNAAMARIQSALSDEFQNMNADMEAEVYRETLSIYARTFTEAELHEITSFYASPLGAKLLNKQPELLRECIEMNQRLLGERLPALFQRVKTRMRTDFDTLRGTSQ